MIKSEVFGFYGNSNYALDKHIEEMTELGWKLKSCSVRKTFWNLTSKYSKEATLVWDVDDTDDLSYLL